MRRKSLLQKSVRKRSVFILSLFLLAATSCHAINIFEILAYKKDVIRAYNTKVLVNPLTGEVKYIWYATVVSGTDGHWEPVTGTSKALFQAAYDQQRNAK